MRQEPDFRWIAAIAAVALATVVQDSMRLTLHSNSATLLLEDFNGETIRSAYGSAPLWFHGSENPGGEGGNASTSTDSPLEGARSYKVVITPNGNGQGDLYEYFKPLVSDSENGNLYDFVQPQSAWHPDRFTQLCFGIRVPVGFPTTLQGWGGWQNVNLGVYVRNSAYDNSGNQEAGGFHFYHFFYIPYTGAWHRVCADYHPTSTRNGTGLPGGGYSDGNTELWGGGRGPWTRYPTAETGRNYFDRMTTFYVAADQGPQYPAAFYLDEFLLSEIHPQANIDQVFNLNGVYRQSDNYVYVGWNRRKDQGSLLFDVRYAFSDIYQLGWTNATPAPGGTGLASPDSGPYNLMAYQTTAIPMGANPQVYVAVRPVGGAAAFNQIVIPVSSSPLPPAPQPPANLRVVQ